MNTERPDHDAAEETRAETGAEATAAGPAEEPSGHPETPGTEGRDAVSDGDGEDGGSGDGGEGHGPTDGGGDGDRRDDGHGGDGGGGRAGRGRSPVVVASVAAAVLLVGGGTGYLAAETSGGAGDRASPEAPGGHGTPPPLVLDGYATGVTGGPAHGIAPGEPNPYGATYRAAGPLPDGPGSAPVYTPRGEVTRDEVARLAKALGVSGTPVAGARAWQVGTGRDGAGPMLRVNRQAPGFWMFSRYAPGTDNCKGKGDRCAQGAAAPAVPPVSVAAAEKAAAPVLKAVGQDDAKVDASQVMGAQRVVNADPVVGGLPTHGWTTGLTVSPQGEVIGGSGQVKEPVKGDTYPVLSARKTLDLMNAAPRTDHRMGIGGCASPVPLKDRLVAPCGASGKGIAKPDVLTVDKAVFGLSAHSSNGRQALVPSWLFQVRGRAGQDAFTVTYPAVDPAFLTSPTLPTAPSVPSVPSTPSGRPDPRPSGSGGAGTSAPVTHDVRVTGYTAQGDDLTVTFEGGVCADYRASAKEGPDRVTVTVRETSRPDRVCILIAKEYQRTLHLDRPLGDRKVVGSDGSPIPQGKPGVRLLPLPPRMSGQPVR